MGKNLSFSALLTAAAFLLIQTLAAQDTPPYWSMAGNWLNGASDKLGSVNYAPLSLVTSGTPRVYINAEGAVGIGTTTPYARLHVAGNTLLQGNTYATGSVEIGGPVGVITSKLALNSSAGSSPLSAQVGGVNKLYVGANGGLSVGNGELPPANGLYVTGNVGIGINTPAQKLSVAGNAYVSGNIGIGTENPSYKLEVQGGSNPAIVGFSSNTAVFGSGEGRGVAGMSANGYGGYFQSENGTGLYARTNRTDKNYAGVFIGNVYATGLYTSSDKNLKKNVEELDDAMSIINKLKPRNYEFRHDGKFAALNLPRGKHYGLLAQELEDVLPNLVNETPLALLESSPIPKSIAADGKAPAPSIQKEMKKESVTVKAVNYTELIPILVKALQEQDQKLQQQQQQIEDLKELVSQLTNGQTSRTTLSPQKISTSLGDGELLQNVPNPVRGSTSISYNIPENAGRAQLIVADALGRIIKTLQLTRSGLVTVDVSSLSSGIYTYSLVVDNKIVQTRKMTVER